MITSRLISYLYLKVHGGEQFITISQTRQFGLFILCAFFFYSCDFPKDPNNSFNDSKVYGLKVGVVNNPPYTNIFDNRFAGKEVRIIEEFAKQHELIIEYIIGSESVLIKQLEQRKIQTIIGGFNKNTVWTKHAGLTTPYDDVHVFLIPKGENRLAFELEKHFNESLTQ